MSGSRRLPPPSPQAALTRRACLRGLALAAASCLLPRRAAAFGDASRLSFALLRHGGRFDPRPAALPRLAWELANRTSVLASPQVKVLGLSDPALFEHPFAVLASDGEVPMPGDAELANLRRYLSYGGFILLDDSAGQPGGAFDSSARALLARALPGSSLAALPRDHVLYKSFYLLDGAVGRVAVAPDLMGLSLGGRVAAVLSNNDLLGALAKDTFGGYQYDPVPGGEQQREKAARLGINLVMYALCLDYKEDQVHIPFILKRRRI